MSKKKRKAVKKLAKRPAKRRPSKPVRANGNDGGSRGPLLEDIDRHALFHEMHRSIEESATVAVKQLTSNAPDMTYPPNYGFSPDELAALRSIPRTPAVKSALRKLIADAVAYPIFHLFSLVDGVVDPPLMTDVQADDRTATELMLHDGFYDSYWAWRRRRPDPGWRLDTYEGD